MLLWAEKDLSIETLVQNLDLVLRILPEDVLGEQAYDQVREGALGLGAMNSPSNNSLTGSTAYDSTISSHLEATTEEDLSAIRASLEMDGDFGSTHDEVWNSIFPANVGWMKFSFWFFFVFADYVLVVSLVSPVWYSASFAFRTPLIASIRNAAIRFAAWNAAGISRDAQFVQGSVRLSVCTEHSNTIVRVSCGVTIVLH